MSKFEIDYTAVDYDSMLVFLDEAAKKLIPEWTNRSETDLNWATLQLVAGLTEISNFYTNFAANEAVLSTVRTLEGFFRLAKSKGYFPVLAQSAEVDVEIVRKTTAGAFTLERGTKVTSLVGVKYFVKEDVTFAIGEDTKTITVVYGDYVKSTLDPSDGTVSQRKLLAYSGYIFSYLKIFVDDSVLIKEYEWIETLAIAESTDEVFTPYILEDGTIQILFGDGVNGKIPPNTNILTYELGIMPASASNDKYGNAGSNVLLSIEGLSTTSITHDEIVGGSAAPSLEELVTEMIVYVSSSARAVTLPDHEALAKRVNTVSIAKALPGGVNLTTLYVADSLGNFLPLSVRNAVESYVQKRNVDGKDVEVRNPTDVLVDMEIIMIAKDSVSKSELQSRASNVVDEMFSMVSGSFASILDVGWVYSHLMKGLGSYVTSLVLVKLARSEGTGVASITLQVSEIGKKGTTTFSITGGVE